MVFIPSYDPCALFRNDYRFFNLGFDGFPLRIQRESTLTAYFNLETFGFSRSLFYRIYSDVKNSTSHTNTLLSIDHGKVIRWLLRIAGVLVICHLTNLALGFPSWQLERLFNLGYEANIPTWFSSFYWAIAFVAAFRCVQLTNQKSEKKFLNC